MSDQKLAAVQAPSIRKKIAEFRPGYTVSVYQKIKEGGKERIQIFKGLVIKISSGAGVDKTFTVRKIVDGIGVEKVFPIHSPNIEKIVPEKKAKIRRSKLYYIRERSGKSARFKETHLSGKNIVVPEEEVIGTVEPTEAEITEVAQSAEKNESEADSETNSDKSPSYEEVSPAGDSVEKDDMEETKKG